MNADEAPIQAASLLELLDLVAHRADSFLAPTTSSFGPRLFGGTVAAQSMAAACRTVTADHRPQSLHAYFILPGTPDQPLRLDVERTRDGRSFTTRRVVASQAGAAIFEMSASFHRDEAGSDWSMAPPINVPDPDMLEPFVDRDGVPSIGHFEIRPLGSAAERYTPPPYWVRSRDELPDDPALRACVLTYLSDMGILAMAFHPGMGPVGSATSLDHAVWFHRPFDPSEWHLFAGGPRSGAGGRGLAVGGVHRRDGALVATVVQEGLFRPPR